ncbi:MAG: hypothetical protein HW390_1623 [Candidatus Brocadiaceae bacterium]|nr:hypothetical protein [Candidatus Brocadiaceae bacterium]
MGMVDISGGSMPNKALHRTYSPSLRYGESAGELERYAV